MIETTSRLNYLKNIDMESRYNQFRYFDGTDYTKGLRVFISDKSHVIIQKMTSAERDNMRKIIVNKVRCKKCYDIIESTHRYDYKSCLCGAISIDGGTDYQKVSWGADRPGDLLPVEDYIDFSYSRYKEVEN